MPTLTDLKKIELELMSSFEAKADALNLLQDDSSLILSSYIKETHFAIVENDDQLTNLISPMFKVVTKKNDGAMHRYGLKVNSITELDEKFLDELKAYWGPDYQSKFEAFEQFLKRLTVRFLERKIESLKGTPAKIFTDIFKLMSTEVGSDLIKLLTSTTGFPNKIIINMMGEKIVYQPQIDPVGLFNKALFDSIVPEPIFTSEETFKTALKIAEASLEIQKYAFKSSKTPCDVVMNTEMASIKITNSKSLNRPILSYCPRFITLAHELMHIAHNVQGIFHKEFPLDKLPLIELAYTSFAVFYTINLAGRLSEVSLTDELSMLPRYTHSGTASTIENLDNPKKQLERVLTLQEGLVKASVLLGYLPLDNPEIAALRHCHTVNRGDKSEVVKNQYYKSIQNAYRLYKETLPFSPAPSNIIGPALSDKAIQVSFREAKEERPLEGLNDSNHSSSLYESHAVFFKKESIPSLPPHYQEADEMKTQKDSTTALPVPK